MEQTFNNLKYLFLFQNSKISMMEESIITSSENRANLMDEDYINYLSTLSSTQQKKLDDFVRNKVMM